MKKYFCGDFCRNRRSRSQSRADRYGRAVIRGKRVKQEEKPQASNSKKQKTKTDKKRKTQAFNSKKQIMKSDKKEKSNKPDKSAKVSNKREKKDTTGNATTEQTPPKENKGGSIFDFLPLVELAFDFLGAFARKLRLNHLRLNWFWPVMIPAI